MSLPFDFQKISHPREWQWPLLVSTLRHDAQLSIENYTETQLYLLARFGGLATAVTTIIFFNTAQEYNCEVSFQTSIACPHPNDALHKAALRINIVFDF